MKKGKKQRNKSVDSYICCAKGVHQSAVSRIRAGVTAAVTGSHQLLWEGNSFFFSKCLAQVGTPSWCTAAKGNKPPKNGYGGKFSLISVGGGGQLIKTRQMGGKTEGKDCFPLCQRGVETRVVPTSTTLTTTLICWHHNFYMGSLGSWLVLNCSGLKLWCTVTWGFGVCAVHLQLAVVL